MGVAIIEQVVYNTLMEITRTTTLIASGIPEVPFDLELPIEPIEYVEPVVDGGELRYLAVDNYPSEYEFPEGVVFADGNMVGQRGIDLAFGKIGDDGSFSVFPVGKYEHGRVSYCIHGERSYPDMQWDYGQAGFIAIPDDFTNPQEAAVAILDEYTAWCNGDVYLLVTVPIHDPDNYDVVGGFIGDKAAEEALQYGY